MNRAGRWRAFAEVAPLAFALSLPLAAILRPALNLSIDPPGESVARWPMMGISLEYVGLITAAYAALRLRRQAGAGSRRRRFARELVGGLAMVGAVFLGGMIAHAAGAAWNGLQRGWTADDLAFLRHSPRQAAASAIGTALGYAILRALVVLWPRLTALRRRHLFWALAQAQLAVALSIVLIVALLWMVATVMTGTVHYGPAFGPQDLAAGSGPVAYALAWFASRVLINVTALVAVMVLVSLVVLPVGALISWLALRRTAGRLNALAAAADALRTGNRSARVQAEGEDEVGQLQTTFNAMAAELERSVGELEAERDRVSGLLQARRQLVAGVSHELRTPVATVRGYLESVRRREAELPSEVRADLEIVARETERLERLIEDLFTLSRAEVDRLALRLAPTDVGAVVRRLAETAGQMAWRRRRVRVLAEVEEGAPPARADETRLEQIVSNLLGNAVRHTPPGGLVAASVAAEDGVVRLEVRDTGEGMAAEDVERVFERYFRGPSTETHEEHDGVGLGLALVKELTDAMGGTVEAWSAPGEGSRFTVRLPRA